jgi:hypothetical protein
MRFRVTVRGERIELRGYVDPGVLAALSSATEGLAMVIASPAEDDYDPFKEAEHRELHHFQVEQENARLEADNARLEAELAQLKTKVSEQALTIGRIRTARSNHPECDKHKGDDPITCGWKAAVLDIDKALS